MTTGALIFAYNNERTDYVEMARWSARNIRRHLGIPTALITNAEISADADFDVVIHSKQNAGTTRYFQDYEQTLTWNNLSRPDSYDVSPWDRTLLLDADYVVAGNQLSVLLDADSDLMCHRGAYNIATGDMLDELNVFGQHRLPMWWATVIMFQKSNRARFVFDSMKMVRDNWKHYRDLYGINNRTYRNDFALSIAIGIVSGHTNRFDDIPWQLATVMPDTMISRTELDGDSYIFEWVDAAQQIKYTMFRGMDFHAMGKRTLGEIVEADFRTRLFDSRN